jgi:glycosyltransferase involved in cell wall biosynthesis
LTKSDRRRPRIFLGLTEIADFYAQLQAGLDELGYDAVFVNLTPHPFYRTDWRGHIPRVARLAIAVAKRDAHSSGKWLPFRVLWRLVALVLRLPLLLWAVATREIFIFAYGSTFFDYRELPLLRLLGKRVVYVFHGSDARPPYLDGAQTDAQGVVDGDALVESTKRKKRHLRTIDRLADVVITGPLSAHLHERLLVSAVAIGIPRTTLRVTVPPTREVLRVLHSPSHARAKGSDAIRAAVERLRERGVPLELVELSGVAHERVLEALNDADLVIDQLYSDTAMAGFAAEAAAAGRAVVVGGYGRDAIESALCGRPFPPVLFCRPEDLERTLERVATDEGLRRDLGRRAREFIEREWSPSAVAERLLDAIDGRRPEWVFDPREIRYVHGVGLTEAQARSLVRATIDRGGVAALCVGDKPDLEAKLVQFAQADPGALAGGAVEADTEVDRRSSDKGGG